MTDVWLGASGMWLDSAADHEYLVASSVLASRLSADQAWRAWAAENQLIEVDLEFTLWRQDPGPRKTRSRIAQQRARVSATFHMPDLSSATVEQVWHLAAAHYLQALDELVAARKLTPLPGNHDLILAGALQERLGFATLRDYERHRMRLNEDDDTFLQAWEEEMDHLEQMDGHAWMDEHEGMADLAGTGDYEGRGDNEGMDGLEGIGAPAHPAFAAHFTDPVYEDPGAEFGPFGQDEPAELLAEWAQRADQLHAGSTVRDLLADGFEDPADLQAFLSVLDQPAPAASRPDGPAVAGTRVLEAGGQVDVAFIVLGAGFTLLRLTGQIDQPGRGQVLAALRVLRGFYGPQPEFDRMAQDLATFTPAHP